MHLNISEEIPSSSFDMWLPSTKVPHKVMTISIHNRTATPIYYEDLLLRFTDNDTDNCPVLPGTLQID